MDTCPCDQCISRVMCINKLPEIIMCCPIISDLIIDDMFELIGNDDGEFVYYLPSLDTQFYFHMNHIDDMYIHRSDGFYYNWVARR